MPRRPPAASADEYGFLLGRHLDAATLRQADVMARDWRVPTHEVLIALGWVSEPNYVHALSAHLAMAAVDGRELRPASPFAEYPSWPKVVAATLEGRQVVAIEARSFTPGVLRSIAATGRAQNARFMLASRREVARCTARQIAPYLIDRSINALWRHEPEHSARSPAAAWQAVFIASALGLAAGGLAVMPELVAAALAALLAVPFTCVTLLRAAALTEVLRPASREPPARTQRDNAALPIYTVLVPLHHEANVVGELVQRLAELDYPAAKLQILLVLEDDDRDTREAVAALDLPGNFETLIVPDRGPRTKPKALNYGLSYAQGQFVVVYDAEDMPEADQIRRALTIFRRSGPDLACVQARLNVYNARASWLARQFALEYSALFDAVLPALERLRLPVPLGGTSNHFRVDRLREIGAWDPYNVTEDADLGIRIARAGLATATLDCTTWEEAPVRLGNWMRQRTRWIKGWMQTYLVHTREPGRLLRELGLRRWAGLHVLMGGILLSGLAHPLCYLLLGFEAASGRLLSASDAPLQRWLWWIALFNLGVGYASVMIVAALAAVRRRRAWLAPSVLSMPLYWLLISVAAYRALFQLAWAPYLWEKTRHGDSL